MASNGILSWIGNTLSSGNDYQLSNPYSKSMQNYLDSSSYNTTNINNTMPQYAQAGYGSYLTNNQKNFMNTLKDSNVDMNVVGNSNNKGLFSDMTGKDWLTSGLSVAQTLAGIGSAISQKNMAKQQLNFAKEQFAYNKAANERNWNAQVKAYNTSLYDKYRARAAGEKGDTSAYNSEYEQNKMY